VAVNDVAIKTYDVNNGDGIELGNSQHITFFNNFLNTGDDCVNFAAGTGADAAKQPVQSDAWIFDNYFRKGHGAVVAGSHTGAWIEKILAEDNVAFGTEIGLRGKSNNINGGGGRYIVYRDNAMKNLLRQAYIFTLEYTDTNGLIDYKPAAEVAQFHDITIKHNSVEFSPDTATPESTGNTNASQKMEVYPSIHIQGDMKSHAYHERIVFDDVVLINANPTKIDGLKDGVFRDVRFKNVKGGGNPWNVTNAPGILFEGSTTPPAK
ncbi:MAG TPA: glycosyl hydrolase family 28 protein, partial [Rhodocyclaceae bacterium]|nr:glycosyl hydrolase family 28 protein [Rhodocyclaceae bacterium]